MKSNERQHIITSKPFFISEAGIRWKKYTYAMRHFVDVVCRSHQVAFQQRCTWNYTTIERLFWSSRNRCTFAAHFNSILLSVMSTNHVDETLYSIYFWLLRSRIQFSTHFYHNKRRRYSIRFGLIFSETRKVGFSFIKKNCTFSRTLSDKELLWLIIRIHGHKNLKETHKCR